MVWNFLTRLSEYPPQYNPKVHGSYDPATYYGKPDTPFTKVTLKDLGAWFARRNKSPTAVVRALSRVHWRYCHKYVFPRYTSLTFLYHITFGWMALFYFLNYPTYKSHRSQKYHW